MELLIKEQGAIQASNLGAIGVIVRSLTTTLDDYPHRGQRIIRLSLNREYQLRLVQWC